MLRIKIIKKRQPKDAGHEGASPGDDHLLALHNGWQTGHPGVGKGHGS